MAETIMKYSPKKPKIKPQHVLLRRGNDVASISSHISCFIIMLKSAELMNLKAAVDWRNGSQKGIYQDQITAGKLGDNVWEWYFKQSISIKEIETQPHDIWHWEPGFPMQKEADLPWNATTQTAIEIWQQIVPKYLFWHESIQTRAEDLFRKYEINPLETIAISHRGTDKYREAIIYPIENYFPIVDALLIENPHYKIWAQPEEKEVLDKIQKRYPNVVVMSEFFLDNSQSKILSDFLNPKSGYEKGLDSITMMIMYSMCNILVKNSSNLSDLAAALSSGRVIFAGVDVIDMGGVFGTCHK